MGKKYNFNEDKYTYYTYCNSLTGTQTVIALSTYAGKTVKGRAKCNSCDEYDIEVGKKLAAARCNAHIAKRRKANALRRYEETHRALDAAIAKADKMRAYLNDATEACTEADEKLNKILEELK